jgi:hypothetical protein
LKKNLFLYISIGVASLGAYLYFFRRGGSTKSINWNETPNFFTTTNGINLFELGKKVGITMSRNKGISSSGYSANKYQQNKKNVKVYWAVYDITNDSLIEASSNASKTVYGASVPKVLVASAALSNNDGKLPTSADYSKVIQLLVKSNNDVWTPIQNIAGGKDAVNNWAKKMGYGMQPARNGGNNASALGMSKFWRDVCKNNFEGAEVIYRTTASCQTSGARSRKYMPTSVYMGGKTGTYNASNHDSCWIQYQDKFYSITVLTELGASGSDVIACMFRGLFDEYIR